VVPLPGRRGCSRTTRRPRGIVERKRPEIALVSAGAGADVVGFGVDQLAKDAVARVIAAFPRIGFKKAYQQVLAEIVARKPEMEFPTKSGR
jgi:hypothetical protein